MLISLYNKIILLKTILTPCRRGHNVDFLSLRQGENIHANFL